METRVGVETLGSPALANKNLFHESKLPKPN